MDIYEENAISKLMRARKGNDVKWDIKFKKKQIFKRFRKKSLQPKMLKDHLK